MSGYLVCESWQRDSHLIRFAIRRLLRIWPALAVSVLLTVCVVGPLFTSVPIDRYAADPLTRAYLSWLLFKDAFSLPGVFDSNPLSTINGSLWTLPIEVRWYEYLALAGLIGFLRWRFLLLLTTFCIAIHYFGIFDVQAVIARGGDRGWKEELGLYFLAGACLSRYRNVWQKHLKISRCLILILAFVLLGIGYVHAAFWLLISLGAVGFAVRSWPGIRRTGRFGDFSYGIYIYAFPMQQMVVAVTANQLSYFGSLLASAVFTFALAWLSWHLVEAPALRLKPSPGFLSADQIRSICRRLALRSKGWV